MIGSRHSQIVPIRGSMLRRTDDGRADMAPGSRSVPDVGADRIGQLLAAKRAAGHASGGPIRRAVSGELPWHGRHDDHVELVGHGLQDLGDRWMIIFGLAHGAMLRALT
jgi:hypothetical protein